MLDVERARYIATEIEIRASAAARSLEASADTATTLLAQLARFPRGLEDYAPYAAAVAGLTAAEERVARLDGDAACSPAT